VPSSLVNTWSVPRHMGPIERRCSVCATPYTPSEDIYSAYTKRYGASCDRPVFGWPSTSPLPKTGCKVRITLRWPASRSTTSHFRPHSSLRLMPVSTAIRCTGSNGLSFAVSAKVLKVSTSHVSMLFICARGGLTAVTGLRNRTFALTASTNALFKMR
jgi:hypothetical protein